jgi:hypothetical protein
LWLDSGVSMPTIFFLALATSLAGGLLSLRLLFNNPEETKA